VIGPPVAVGLRGVEAEILYRNLLIQTQALGVRLPAAQAGGQSSTAGTTSSGLITPPPQR